jgi:hypothetical protein
MVLCLGELTRPARVGIDRIRRHADVERLEAQIARLRREVRNLSEAIAIVTLTTPRTLRHSATVSPCASHAR